MYKWVLAVTILLLMDQFICINSYTAYKYKYYSYRKKQKNERKIRYMRQDCERKEECLITSGLDQTNCIRKCMSKDCFDELYGSDPLEEGEIDVRFNSFKGCILQNIRR